MQEHNFYFEKNSSFPLRRKKGVALYNFLKQN